MKKIKNIFKKPIFWIILIIIVGVVIIFLRSGETQNYDFVKIVKGDIVQEVSVTGNVQPVEGVDLAFERSGRVKRVAVNVGDKVYRGEPLVLLGISDLYSGLDEANANLNAEKANLSKVKKGSTVYVLDVKRSEINEAKQDLINKYNSVLTTVRSAYAQADDAIRTRTVGFFKRSNYVYTLKYNACNSSDENQANFARLESENMLVDWRENIDLFDGNLKSDFLALLDKAQGNLSVVSNFLNETGDTLITGCELSDDTVFSYRTKLSTARNNINTAFSNLDSLEQSIALKSVSLDKKQKELDKLLAGATEEEIKAQEAVVNKAEASVNKIKDQIEKGILKAPFSGRITKIDIEMGEIVDMYDPVVSVISESGFKIEVNMPEVDIANVNIGDLASVTLDAYGENELFNAKVIIIDSAETVIEGISAYGATLEFKEMDERIKSGMTANVDILTGSRENIIYIPRRSIFIDNDKQFVRVVKNELIEEREVDTGLEGSRGNVEIVNGLKEGEKVITFFNEE